MPNAWGWGIFGLALGAFTVAFIVWVFWIQHVRQIYLDYDNHNRLSRVPESWREPPRMTNALAQLRLDVEMFRARVRYDMCDDLKSNLRYHKRIVLFVYIPLAALIMTGVCAKILGL